MVVSYFVEGNKDLWMFKVESQSIDFGSSRRSSGEYEQMHELIRVNLGSVTYYDLVHNNSARADQLPHQINKRLY